MSVIIACPSCGGKLRVSDELRDELVRCPKCDHTFETTARPDALDVPLQLSLDDPDADSPPTPAGDRRGPIGAVELDPAPRAEQPPPPREKKAPPPRPSLDDVPDFRRRGPRRDAEPDRGTVVLVLGILSLASLTISCFPLGLLLGLISWIMGQGDLRKMKRGVMDGYGEGMTRAGWICGLIGVILNGLILLTCMGFFGWVWYEDNHRPLPPTPPPPMRKQFQPKQPPNFPPGQPPQPQPPPGGKNF